MAFEQGRRSFTYAETARRVDALAVGLAGLGVGPGSRVAYLGPNDIATFEVLFAACRLGAIFVPMNTRLSGPEISYMLEDSGASVLVYGPEVAELVSSAMALGAAAPHLVAVDLVGQPGGLDYESLIADSAQATPAFTPAEVTLDDDALVLYTSGTTGRPKGAVLTHGNLTFNTINQLAHTDVLSTDRVLCTAPLFHVVGLGQVTLPTLFKGGTVVVVPKFDVPSLLHLIADRRAVAFSAVPTMLQMLSDHPDFADADLSTLRYIVYGGSPVLARVARVWMGRSIDLLQGYGMTEASPGVLLSTAVGAADHPVSPGVPHFFTELALAQPDGSVVPGPGTGELVVRGPTVFRGYLNRPEETATAFEGGWFHSGDVVRIDVDGWGYVVDRVKDMIISGGENIYPAEVEAVIADMPGVVDCAVVGVPDEKWGEVGFAVIVPDPHQDLDVDAVRAYLDGRLARYKIPKYVQLTSELPRNAAGKVLKQRLRETPFTGEDDA